MFEQELHNPDSSEADEPEINVPRQMPQYQTPKKPARKSDGDEILDPLQILDNLIEGKSSPSPGKNIQLRKQISQKKMVIE